MGYEVVDWNHLAQNRDKWQALVNSFGFYKRYGISRLAKRLLASQEELCSTDLVNIARRFYNGSSLSRKQF